MTYTKSIDLFDTPVFATEWMEHYIRFRKCDDTLRPGCEVVAADWISTVPTEIRDRVRNVTRRVIRVFIGYPATPSLKQAVISSIQAKMVYEREATS